MNWVMLTLLAFAAARATHLVADDVFPFGGLRDYLDKQRGWQAYIGYGLGCTFCISIWAGFFSAWIAMSTGWVPFDNMLDDFWPFMVLWFAFAEVIVLIECTIGWLVESRD